MSYSHFYKRLEANAVKMFPGLKEIETPTWDHLISPLELELPRAILSKVEAAVRALYAVSRKPSYVAQLEQIPGVSDVHVQNHSVLMAYDFHTTVEGDCSLVEVNTNASGFLFSALMEQTHADKTSLADHVPTQLLENAFREELRLSGHGGEASARVAITDEDIAQQKMYAEFLMYRDWFRSFGWTADFCEGSEFTFDGKLNAPFSADIDLVYNRLTDFYLENPAHQALQAAYRGGVSCLSPHPREYWLLADKQRLIDFSTPEFLEKIGASAEECEAIRSVLIPTFEKSAFADEHEIWTRRKEFFFKPKRSFGGKSVYRGESVSRKPFERLMAEDILIQKFTPAQRIPTDDPRSVLNNWKFDLRFYVYQDQVQMCAARIYQGQVTNFQSQYGGYTKVKFV